jgi:hypothetical protein
MILLLHPLVAEAKKPKPAPKPPPMAVGTVANAPFEVVRALGTGDPNHPGVLAVTLADRPLPCGEVPPADATLVVVGFEPVAGTSSIGPGMVLSQERKLFGFLQARATLVALPDSAGATGKVRVESVTGDGTTLSGEVDFELCEVVLPAPPPTSAFEERVVTAGSDEGDPKVKARVPVEWTEGKDALGDTTWTAQDKLTRFRLSSTCSGACEPARFAENAERWLSDQTSGFVGVEGYEVKLGKNELVSEGTRVARYTIVANGLPTSVVAVLKWDPAREGILVCELQTPAKNTAILDQAEQACLTATWADPPR